MTNMIGHSTINSNPKKAIKWMSVPYFPISFKYMILMLVVFLIGVSGTSLSKFEAFAVSFVAYSTAIILDRAENLFKFATNVVTHGD